MREVRNGLLWVALCFGAMLLIFDSRTAADAAANGIDICIKSVIPALFPFLFLTNVITAKLAGKTIALLRPLGRFCKIPKGAEIIFLMGLLGGYPIGAQCISRAYEADILDKQNAQRMLGFCSHCGPGFLFGILGVYFKSLWMLFLLWVIHILSAIIVAWILPGAINKSGACVSSSISVAQAMKQSILAMAQVCGWVVLFRVIISMIHRWAGFLLTDVWKVLLIGILELTNGCLMLNQIDEHSLRLLIASGLIGFGGICVALQTRSVVSSRLSLKYYLPGKWLQACISVLMCGILYFPRYIWPLIAFIAVTIVVFRILNRKLCFTSRYSRAKGV